MADSWVKYASTLYDNTRYTFNRCPKYKDFNKLKPCHNSDSFNTLIELVKENCNHHELQPLIIKYLNKIHELYTNHNTIRNIDKIEIAKDHIYVQCFFI